MDYPVLVNFGKPSQGYFMKKKNKAIAPRAAKRLKRVVAGRKAAASSAPQSALRASIAGRTQ